MNLQSFRTIIANDNLLIWFSPKWKDSTSIRAGLLETPEILQSLSGISNIDLKHSPPLVNGPGGISFSHSKLGGVVLISRRSGIGVDLEEISRLNERVVNRVSSDQERRDAPDPKFLWPAKEASFKALYPDNRDLVIQQFHVRNWSNGSEGSWSFEVTNQKKRIKGYLFSDESLLVAVALTQL